MDFSHINQLDKASRKGRSELFRIGMALLFLVGAMLYVVGRDIGDGSMYVVIAAMIGGYMAMNIGANDVANNVGPAVGSKALTLGGALVIAAFFEASGAILAGGEVVSTIRNGIIDPAQIADAETFVWVMMAALLAAALWLNLATIFGAPVSTTHSIVGAVLGAGVAASGFGIANWDTVGKIVLSWVVSPLMGALIAAGFLYLIKRSITYKSNLLSAAQTMVPWLIAVMAFAFGTYIVIKGLSKVLDLGFGGAVAFGTVLAIVVFFLVRGRIVTRSETIENSKEGVNQLFTVPLIFAAALLSFAHGSNDVANAVAPLAAIVEVISSGGAEIAQNAPVPLWVMVIGGVGLAVGLALFGPRLIRTVGSEITELDQMRAYCIAMAATITVILASQLGIPVSTTHVAVGGVFGVGFLREYLKSNYARMIDDIKEHHPDGDQHAIESFLRRFDAASAKKKGKMLRVLKRKQKKRLDPANFSKGERRRLKKIYRQELVKRSLLLRIAAAWIITVPASAVMAAMLFFMIRGMQL
ncbi:MAG TPA: inorganic phosphate transporter [Azoarcus sp.]|nr:inorganic phosphate transporter [Azoarcus sp.]